MHLKTLVHPHFRAARRNVIVLLAGIIVEENAVHAWRRFWLQYTVGTCTATAQIIHSCL